MTDEREVLEMAAIASRAGGPFSFCFEGERYTTAGGVTYCASTYNAMMSHGWVEEVQ